MINDFLEKCMKNEGKIHHYYSQKSLNQTKKE